MSSPLVGSKRVGIDSVVSYRLSAKSVQLDSETRIENLSEAPLVKGVGGF